jgi:hypothetical protein
MIPRAIRAAALAVALAAAGTSLGCYWSSPPSTPHRSERFDLAKIPDLGAPTPRPLAGTRLVVLGRFDTTAPNPVGGLYDRSDYEVSPLYRTYFYKDGAVEIFEHVGDALRASGLTVLKDYGGGAQAALLEPPIRAKSPVLVRGTLIGLQHDQVREKHDAGDFQVGRVVVDVTVTETDGRPLLRKTYDLAGKAPWDEKTDFLKLLGWKLTEQLTADPEFLRAIGAGGAGSASGK